MQRAKQTLTALFGLGAVLSTGWALAATPEPTGPPQPDPKLTGEQIVSKMLDRNQMGHNSGQAEIRMKLKLKGGSILDRKMLTRSKRTDGLQRTRMTFLEPEDQRGIEVLMLQQKDGQDLQYLYLPRLKKSRRMSGAAKNGRFQGSDFTYADMESRDVKDGTYKRLPDGTYGKQKMPIYRVDVTPKPGPSQQYSKVELHVDVKTMLPLKMVFYDRSGKKLKVLKTRRIKKISGNYIPTKVTMQNVQEHSETVIEVGAINTKAKYPDSLFRPDALGR